MTGRFGKYFYLTYLSMSKDKEKRNVLDSGFLFTPAPEGIR